MMSRQSELKEAVPSIVKYPGVCGGEACFLRTRIPVWVVVRMRLLGMSEAAVIASYPALTAEDLLHGYNYACANAGEIARAIAENKGA